MRQWLMLAALLAGEIPLAASSAAARPFGFLFGDEQPERAYRPRHRRAAQAPLAIPLPVPRPHFADDPPDHGAIATTATSAPNPQPPLVKTPELKASEPAAPEPPAKPPALGGAVPERTTADGVTSPKASSPASTPKAPDPAAQPAPSMTTPDSAKPLTVTVPVTTPPLPPQKPADITPPVKPAIAASGATTATSPRQPADDADCVGRLVARSVVAEPTPIGPQPDDRCSVVQPVRLSRLTLSGGEIVEFPDKPLIACVTADVFSLYVRDLLSPLAKGTFGSGVGAVWTGPGLECRSRDHILGAKLSAHGQGLAVDIAQVKLADGRVLAVGDPKTPADTAFETAARAAGCGYFHTVLGPGSDSYHRTHWHFDLEVRGAQGDSKYCK